MSRRSERKPGMSAARRLQVQGWAEVDGAVVRGWARDPLAVGAAVLFLTVDEGVVARIEAGQESAAGLEGVAEARGASFHFVLPKSIEDGRPHRLSLRLTGGQMLAFRTPSGARVQDWALQMPGRFTIEGVVDGMSGPTLRGWVVRRHAEDGRVTGGETIEILHEERRVGQVTAGLFRPDVAEVLGGEPNCGFGFVLPVGLRNGEQLTLTVRSAVNRQELTASPIQTRYLSQDATSKLGELYSEVSRVCSQTYALRDELKKLLDADEFSVEQYNAWAVSYFPALRAQLRGRAIPLGEQPLVSIVCPVYKPEPGALDATIKSVRLQSYAKWELILVDDAGGSKPVAEVLARHAREDKRVRVITQKKNGGISRATNAAIAAAKGRFVGFLDHDDLLENVAVEVMVSEALRTGAKVLYSDEDKIEPGGILTEPHLKSDWNWRLLLSYNYLCHFLLVERCALDRAGLLDAAFDGAQDHDLALRLAETVPGAEIHHVPAVLYHWRKSANSTALRQDTKCYAADAGQRTVAAHLDRRALPGRVVVQANSTRYAVEWSFKATPSVSILIPFRDQAKVTKTCLDAILSKTLYPDYEVVLIDNWSTSEETLSYCKTLENEPRVRCVRIEEEFNYSCINNVAAASCKSEYLLFLNNDVFISQPDWLERLVAEAQADPEVAGVGAKLLYPNGTVQHAGVVLGVGGVADHAFRGLGGEDAGYMFRAVSAQQMSAVTAACLLCRAAAFREVGGFDEVALKVAFNDVDLCLRLGAAGHKIVFTPGVVAEHHESISRGNDLALDKRDRFYSESQVMKERWGALLADDPYYNPLFSRSRGMFSTLSSKPPLLR